MKRRAFLILFLFSYCSHVWAQTDGQTDSIGVKVYFRQGYSALDAAYRDNGLRLGAFAERVRAMQHDTTCRMQSIRIVSGSSPEGSSTVNNRLSENRAAQIRLFLQQRLRLDNTPYEVVSQGVDWLGLTAQVEASDMPYRTEVLNILRHTPEQTIRNGMNIDERKLQLKALQGGRPWQYMMERFFPELRNSEVRIVCAMRPVPEPVVAVVAVPEPVEEPQVVSVEEPPVVTAPQPVVVPERKPFYMALKTNLLYDAVLIPNIGIEFYTGRGWSVGGNWMYAWWKNNRRHDFWRTYGGEIDIRKYFGRRAAQKPLTGHHLGIYGQMLTYDFELGSTGYLSKLSYGVGIEYGYALPIGRRLNLDFGIGIGYLGGEYKEYEPIDTHYVWKRTKQRHWFGPTKAEISLVWLIGHGNYNKK